MTNNNIQNLITSCDYLGHNCIRIADTQHGSAWLFDKLMRYFTSEQSAVAVTIPIVTNRGCGEATISRSGQLTISHGAEA